MKSLFERRTLCKNILYWSWSRLQMFTLVPINTEGSIHNLQNLHDICFPLQLPLNEQKYELSFFSLTLFIFYFIICYYYFIFTSMFLNHNTKGEKKRTVQNQEQNSKNYSKLFLPGWIHPGLWPISPDLVSVLMSLPNLIPILAIFAPGNPCYVYISISCS